MQPGFNNSVADSRLLISTAWISAVFPSFVLEPRWAMAEAGRIRRFRNGSLGSALAIWVTLGSEQHLDLLCGMLLAHACTSKPWKLSRQGPDTLNVGLLGRLFRQTNVPPRAGSAAKQQSLYERSLPDLVGSIQVHAFAARSVSARASGSPLQCKPANSIRGCAAHQARLLQ